MAILLTLLGIIIVVSISYAILFNSLDENYNDNNQDYMPQIDCEVAAAFILAK